MNIFALGRALARLPRFTTHTSVASMDGRQLGRQLSEAVRREISAQAQHQNRVSDVIRVPSLYDLRVLIADWEGHARRKFECAEHETDPSARRFIEHGAIVYFNCAQALKDQILIAQRSSEAPPGDRS